MLRLIILILLCVSAFAQNAAVPVGYGTTLPATCAIGELWTKSSAPVAFCYCPATNTWSCGWQKYTVTAIANGVNGCANANGCWQINGVLGANKTAGLTQSVTLVQLPANGYVSSYRIKTATACTGTTTLLTGLGTASSASLYLVSAVTGYNLKTAVATTNLSVALPLIMGSDTSAAVNAVASVTSTVDNLDQIVAGCSFDVWLSVSVLP